MVTYDMETDREVREWRGCAFVDADPDGWDGSYRVGSLGVAWRVLGWEVEPDADTEWTGAMPRTGRLLAIMVGDDRPEAFEPDELVAIEREAYCGVCGQIGCAHDGR